MVQSLTTPQSDQSRNKIRFFSKPSAGLTSSKNLNQTLTATQPFTKIFIKY